MAVRQNAPTFGNNFYDVDTGKNLNYYEGDSLVGIVDAMDVALANAQNDYPRFDILGWLGPLYIPSTGVYKMVIVIDPSPYLV